MEANNEMLLKSVKKTIFNPLLQTKDQVRAFLLTFDVGTAHPYNGLLLLLVKAGEIVELDLSSKPDSYFLDAVNLSEVGEVLHERRDQHQDSLGQCANYAIASITDNVIDIPFPSSFPENDILLFALAQSYDPSYFDTCIASSPSADRPLSTILCYNYRSNNAVPSISRLVHSGDKIKVSLLHSVNLAGLPSPTDSPDPFVVFVSGYSKNPLHKYKKQRPALLLVNHETQTCYLVPVPLDQATIGEGTICCPLVGRRMLNEQQKTIFRFTILPNPPIVCDLSAGGERLPDGQESINKAIDMSNNILADYKNNAFVYDPKKEKSVAKSEEVALANKMEKALNDETFKNQKSQLLTLIYEDDLRADPQFFQPTFSLSFGKGLTIPVGVSTIPALNPDATILPICLGGLLEGPTLLVLGQSLKTFGTVAPQSHQQLSSLYSNSTAIMCLVSDRMLDAARQLNPQQRINGLFILRPVKGAPGNDILDDSNKRRDWIEEVGGNCVTALSGPNSIVVVQILDNYFFYRGVAWPEFFHGEKVPDFGADVTDEVLAFQNWCEKRYKLGKRFPWPILVDLKADRQVYFKGQKFAVDGVSKIFEQLSFDELLANQSGIRDVLTQLSVILNTEEIKTVGSDLTTFLKQKISLKVRPFLSEFVQFLKTSMSKVDRSPEQIKADNLKKNVLNAKVKSVERESSACVQWLINDLAFLVSTRTSSNKKHDLKQLIRKQKMNENLSAAKSMNLESFQALLEEHCSELGCVMGNTDEEELKRLLKQASSNQLLNSIMADRSVSSVDLPISLQSSTEMSLLMEAANDVHSGPLVPSQGSTADSLALTLPQGFDEQRSKSSAIPWALYDEFVNLQSPAQVFWIDKANASHVATLRIALRSTIACSQVSRSFGLASSSPDLGFLLILLITDTMKNFAKSFAVPGPGDFENEQCKIMRGLFGQLLCVLASGQYKPLSNAFQLVQSNPKLEIPPVNHLWIYSRVVNLFPYTCWTRENLDRHVAMILCKMVRKNIVDPICEPMRKSITEMKNDAQESSIATRNQQLMFLKIAIHVVRYIQVSLLDIEAIKDLASQVLSFEPQNVPEEGGYGIVLRYLVRLSKTGTTSDAEKKHVIKTCHDIFSKRSAQHKVSKNRIVESLDSDNMKTAEELAKKSLERCELVSEYFLETEPHDQGIEMIRKLAKDLETQKYVDIEMIKLAKSDAERNRVPWRVGPFQDGSSDLVTEKDVLNMLKCISTGNLFKPKERPRPDGTSVVIAGQNATALTPKQRLLKKLENVPKNQKAIELVQNLDNLCALDILKLSDEGAEEFSSFFLDMAKILGMIEGDVDGAVRDVICAYLDEWRDVVQGDQKAALVLLAKK